jgi:hypothetical protein
MQFLKQALERHARRGRCAGCPTPASIDVQALPAPHGILQPDDRVNVNDHARPGLIDDGIAVHVTSHASRAQRRQPPLDYLWKGPDLLLPAGRKLSRPVKLLLKTGRQAAGLVILVDDTDIFFTEAGIAVFAMVLAVILVIVLPMFVAVITVVLAGGRSRRRCEESRQQ